MAENSLVQDFVCDYCGGEVDGYFKFQVFINEGTPDEEIREYAKKLRGSN